MLGMPTQEQIAKHLDMSQQAVSDLIGRLGAEWKSETLDAIRVTYIRHLRGQATGHKSDARDDKLKSELDALYGIDLEINLLNEHTRAALTQLAGFEHVAPE